MQGLTPQQKRTLDKVGAIVTVCLFLVFLTYIVVLVYIEMGSSSTLITKTSPNEVDTSSLAGQRLSLPGLPLTHRQDRDSLGFVQEDSQRAERTNNLKPSDVLKMTEARVSTLNADEQYRLTLYKSIDSKISFGETVTTIADSSTSSQILYGFVVKKTDRTIQVITDTNKVHTISVDSNTAILLQGTISSLEQIVEGDKVRVEGWYVSNSSYLHANTIAVLARFYPYDYID